VCTNLTKQCTVSCVENHIYYDGDITKTYSCNDDNIWSPFVPKTGCLGKFHYHMFYKHVGIYQRGVIRRRKSKKYREYNTMSKKKDKNKNYDLQNTTPKTKNGATPNSLKSGGEIRWKLFNRQIYKTIYY